MFPGFFEALLQLVAFARSLSGLFLSATMTTLLEKPNSSGSALRHIKLRSADAKSAHYLNFRLCWRIKAKVFIGMRRSNTAAWRALNKALLN